MKSIRKRLFGHSIGGFDPWPFSGHSLLVGLQIVPEVLGRPQTAKQRGDFAAVRLIIDDQRVGPEPVIACHGLGYLEDLEGWEGGGVPNEAIYHSFQNMFWRDGKATLCLLSKNVLAAD